MLQSNTGLLLAQYHVVDSLLLHNKEFKLTCYQNNRITTLIGEISEIVFMNTSLGIIPIRVFATDVWTDNALGKQCKKNKRWQQKNES